MANQLALLVADGARELCFEYRQDHLSAATNNWEVAKKVRAYLQETSKSDWENSKGDFGMK